MRSTAAPAEARLTYDDFLRLPDDGQRHEIIDGAHHVTPSPSRRHQQLVGRLHARIAWFLDAHPEAGEIYVAPFDVVLSHHDIVEPDLLFVARDQMRILTDANVQGPPALVVEVLSKSTRKRDVHTKRRLFEHAGVKEYWLVDPDLDAVQVFRSEGDRLKRVATLSAADQQTLTTPLLPGWSLALRDLFRTPV